MKNIPQNEPLTALSHQTIIYTNSLLQC